MRPISLVGGAALALAFLAAPSPLPAQIDSNFQGLSPPVRKITLLVDTKGEEPPVYSGAVTAPVPGPGEVLELQLYLPEAAGRNAFGMIVEFDDTDSSFTKHFTIEPTSRGWTTVLAQDATGTENLRNFPLETPMGADGPMRFALYPRPVPISITGLLATFKLTTRQSPPRNEPLRLGFTAAVHSTTPPARLWHYRTLYNVYWQ